MANQRQDLSYLLTLPVLPLPLDDNENENVIDSFYIDSCRSVQQLRSIIRFWYDCKPELSQSAQARLSKILREQQHPHGSRRHPSRHSKPRRQQQQQQTQSRSSPTTNGPSRTDSASTNATLPTSNPSRDVKKEKRKFLVFVNVLLQYLKHKDLQMHHMAKDIVQDCYRRNKKGEAGYESVTAVMRGRLIELVGEHYWKRAHQHLIRYIQKEQQQQHKNHQHLKAEVAQVKRQRDEPSPTPPVPLPQPQLIRRHSSAAAKA